MTGRVTDIEESGNRTCPDTTSLVEKPSRTGKTSPSITTIQTGVDAFPTKTIEGIESSSAVSLTCIVRSQIKAIGTGKTVCQIKATTASGQAWEARVVCRV